MQILIAKIRLWFSKNGILGVCVIAGVLIAILSIPGMPKVFHFDQAIKPKAVQEQKAPGGTDSSIPIQSDPVQSQPSSQSRQQRSALKKPTPRGNPPSNGATGNSQQPVTQTSTGDNSPNINGLNGNVTLNYGTTGSTGATAPKETPH